MMSERYLPPTPPHERSALDAALPEDSAHETATPDQPADGGQTLLRGELTSGRQDPPVDIVPFPSQLVIARRHSSTRAIIRSRGREKRKRRRIPAISQPDTRVFRFDRSVAVAIHPKAECTEKQRQNERVLERRRRQTDTAPTSGRVQPKEELHKPCANFIISCRYKCYRFKPCAKDGGGSSEALVTIKEQANLQSFTFIHITPTGTDLYRRGKRSDRILGDFITITSRKCQEDTIFRSFCRLAHPEPKRAGNRRAYTRSSYRASHRRMQREEDDENFRTGGDLSLMTTRGFGINPELVRQPLGILPQRARIEAADSSLQSTTRARLMAGEDVGVDDEVQELTAEQRAAFEEEEEQLRRLGAHDRSYEGRE